MRIDGIRVQGSELVLQTTDPEARRLAYNFKAGEYELKRSRKKRSLNANGYCWDLCRKIAEAVNIPKEDVYRRAIREVGTFTPFPIREDAIDRFSEIWRSKGIGWFIDVVDDSKISGYKKIFAYHGSSTYDVKEMSRLIDSLIQDAKAVGVDVLSEAERTLLLQEWGNEIKTDKST